jgi:Trk K+ transport system NAD-binding subunit
MNSNEDRNYGYGAAGEVSTIKKQKHSLKALIRYRFDNSINKGQGAFVAWLAIFGLLFSLVISVIRYIMEDEGVLREILWGTSNSVLFDGKIPTGTFTNKAIAIAIWLASVTIAATIIAFVTSKLRDRVEELRRGKTPILESGHTLILGWSNRAFPIIEQLAIANSNKRGSIIAIFADVDRAAIEDQIASRVNNLGKTKIIIRNGDPTSPTDLARTNIAKASSIIVLDSDSKGDSTIVSTVLSIKAVDPTSVTKVIAEMDNRIHASALSDATEGRVIAIQSNEIISRVTAQASRQPGLSTVILDLLDFEGDEIYFADVPQLTGLTYGKALASFDGASIIGIRTAAGLVAVNPPAKTLINKGDQVIAIASDDDRVIYSGNSVKYVGIKARKGIKSARKPEHLLIIGWSHMGTSVLAELTPFLPKGSTISIVADTSLFDKAILPKSTVNGVKVTFAPHTGEIETLAKIAKNKRFNEVIILAYRSNISTDDADTQTMLTMLLMNKLFREEGNGVEPTRLVAEILDSSKTDLARVAAVDDLVVSDNLAALMIAQVSENPALSPVFEDLFDADGASINVLPITDYIEVGTSVPFGKLVVAAGERGESAIGYYTHKKGASASAVALNPEKSTMISAAEGDGLIVIGTLS